MSRQSYSLFPGAFDDSIKSGLTILDNERIIRRIRDHDHTVWKNSPAEITNRLGWLRSPEVTRAALEEITAFSEAVRPEFQTVVLIGMGGSSLAPEVFSRAFKKGVDRPELIVLDTTDPDFIRSVENRIDLRSTLFLVATKSGGTVETISLMKYFYNRVGEADGNRDPGSCFSAITDPGSGLETQAKTLNFRKIFLNDPDIGGRYSALSFFGIVPAALLGIDIPLILERASGFAANTLANSDQTAQVLGTAMGVLAAAGRDKITLLGDAQWLHLGPWIEQLIAESTGKEGKGILPVDREGALDPALYSDDRIFVLINQNGQSGDSEFLAGLKKHGHPVIELIAGDIHNIGIQFFLWEMATIIAGYFLKINPFDQPDVESAKVRAKQLLEKYRHTGEILRPEISFSDTRFDLAGGPSGRSVPDILKGFVRSNLHNGCYIAVQAYLAADEQADKALLDLCRTLRSTYRVPVTLGYGPRFLHSTGQLHKGDAGKGIFIQLINRPGVDLQVPDRPGAPDAAISFGNLRNAQAFGDREALISAGRKVLTVFIKQNIRHISSLL